MDGSVESVACDSTSVSSYDGCPSEESAVSSTSATVSATKHTSVTSFLPPCRLCGAVASGFHYGANTCEACKAFFRRCTSKDFQPKACPNNGECTEVIRGRLVCVPCRFEKCLLVGMTKSASKKGRYTHERRTQYTKEIKGEDPKIVKTEAAIPKDQCTGEQPFYQQTLDQINLHSIECFPEMNAFMEHKASIVKRINTLIAENCPDSVPGYPIYSPGNGDLQLFKSISEGFTNAAQDIKTANMSLRATPTQTLKSLFGNWMSIAEFLFIQLTKFAKQLPGFSHLHIDDKIVLLKAARIEVSTLMAHPGCRPDKNLIAVYSPATGELILTPMMLFDEEFSEFNTLHNTVLARLIKNQYTLEDMNVIIAFILLCPDREGLVEPKKVEELQGTILKILEYTLKKNHPTATHKLAETLLILPELREISEQMRRLLYASKQETNPDLSPLINEVL